MQTKPKSNSVITTEIDGTRITFRVKDAGSVTLNTEDLSPAVRSRALQHGMIQRISDAAALSRNPDTGLPASPQDKLAAMEELVAHYASGTEEWGRKRAAGAGAEGGITLRAVAAVQGVSVETMRERVAALAEKRGTTTRAILAALAKQEAVARKVAEMRAAGGDSKVAEELLGELAG